MESNTANPIALRLTDVRKSFGAVRALKGVTLALVVTEAATNLVKHAQAGQLLLRTLDEAEGPGVELLTLDTGPGMANVGQCLQDGYSTAGSPGTGLGAITSATATASLRTRQSSSASATATSVATVSGSNPASSEVARRRSSGSREARPPL